MSRDYSLSEWGKRPDLSRVTIGGSSRVARLFLPKSNSSAMIRLGAGRQRAVARRQLARMIEPRRMAS
jgi:hypothetical protein